MAWTDLFRGGRSAVKGKARPGAAKEHYSVNDLIALGRLDEARKELERRLKTNPRQHQVRLKLADLLMQQGRRVDAVDVYLQVVDGYASDGFYDKAHALLAKLWRMLPSEGRIAAKMRRLEHAQELDHLRGVVIEAVTGAGRINMSSFTIQTLWADIVKCPLIERLSERQLAKLFSHVDLVKLDEGEPLASAGEDRNEMFIVIQGELAAQILLASGKRTDLRSFGPGDMVGENALLKRKSWPASYVAKRRTSMFRLDRGGLEALLVGETDPRGLLDALRSQGHDVEVDQTLSRLSHTE